MKRERFPVIDSHKSSCGVEGRYEISLQPPSPTRKEFEMTQPRQIAEMSYPRHTYSVHCLDLLRLGDVMYEGRRLSLQIIFQVRPYHCGVQGKNTLEGGLSESGHEASKHSLDLRYRRVDLG